MGRRGSAEREQFWRGVLRRQRKSGQSIRQFCLDNEITETAFYSWRRRLNPPGSRTRNISAVGPGVGEEAAAPTPFIPVNVQALTEPAGMIEVVHPRGHVVRVPESFDHGALERLLNVLDGAGRRRS
jgi:hypothetical protein